MCEKSTGSVLASLLFVIVLGQSSSWWCCHAFAPSLLPALASISLLTTPTTTTTASSKRSTTRLFVADGGSRRRRRRGDPRTVDDDDVSFLLKDFSLYNGEVVDPYQVLKVSRRANTHDIKQAYRRLSRQYHPDAIRNLNEPTSILPGACNNLQEVRDHWERINWSYALLQNPATRRKYDRHVAWADPAQALQRAAVAAAWDGVTSLGRGLWKVGTGAVTTTLTTIQKQQQQEGEGDVKENNVASAEGVSGGTETAGEATIMEYKSHSYSLGPGLLPPPASSEMLEEE